MKRIYQKWQATRSNEDFDRAQMLAGEMTQHDRDAGRLAPDFGYSHERFEQAAAIVKAATEGDVEYYNGEGEWHGQPSETYLPAPGQLSPQEMR